MMKETNLTSEAIRTLQYIDNVLIRRYPTDKVGVEYFLLAALENWETVAYKMLKAINPNAVPTMTEWFQKRLAENSKENNKKMISFSEAFEKVVNKSGKIVSTGHILIEVLNIDTTINLRMIELIALILENGCF